jgi:hypothetical protein
MALVEERSTLQAIVTVNPEIFTRVVVPEYQLDRRVDLIVTSWEQGTDDKVALCECAITQRIAVPLTEGLLVDNRADAIHAWRAKGGVAYHFRGENAFCEDFASLINHV